MIKVKGPKCNAVSGYLCLSLQDELWKSFPVVYKTNILLKYTSELGVCHLGQSLMPRYYRMILSTLLSKFTYVRSMFEDVKLN